LGSKYVFFAAALVLRHAAWMSQKRACRADKRHTLLFPQFFSWEGDSRICSSSQLAAPAVDLIPWIGKQDI